jgi:hypothetical protein
MAMSTNAHSNELQHDGLGDIIFGDKLGATKLKFQNYGTELEGCQYVTIPSYPDIYVMVVDGIITRLSTDNVQLIKQGNPFYGLATGTMTFTSFKQIYPQIEVQLHEYESGYYLRWYNQGQNKAIVVDYVHGKIVEIKAGLVPEVLFVEGCA